MNRSTVTVLVHIVRILSLPVPFLVSNEKYLPRNPSAIKPKQQRAHGLPAADSGGTSDPYCCLTLEHDPPLRKPHPRDFHKKTHIVKKVPLLSKHQQSSAYARFAFCLMSFYQTLDPVWGEILELHSENVAREFVRFYVFDHDNIGSDDFLCWGEVVLAEVKAAGGHVEKVYVISVYLAFVIQNPQNPIISQ